MTLFDTNVVSAFVRSDARTRTPTRCGHVDAALRYPRYAAAGCQ